MSESILRGRVKWFRESKGFGFIEVEDGKDIFVHISQVEEPLQEGDWVEFVTKEGKKGPVATRVKKIVN
ncbi:MAG: cold shock domain-containing protein [Bdellovibrionales bacterium]|nr:cold shock domain-containing protein [Bdellovibrionales bacterium]